MSTVVETPVLVACLTNERLGLCANVREVRESEEHELLVVDTFSGEVIIMRTLPNKELAVRAAKSIVEIVAD
jgi:hypothetical protein